MAYLLVYVGQRELVEDGNSAFQSTARADESFLVLLAPRMC